ncbi:MAG TPA: SWIM zinc finger family protein [Falsiroseomonas sp.]|jgi:uncharacterized Zn finger protein|nr:SWIM zinc finger family protein [Falsiroseomonas sp.]
MAYDDGGWPDYVPVAERRRRAAQVAARLKKQGRATAPVVVEGRAIVTTFWGKAWCSNLESYRDYESRLPRGRTYLRNGSVIDLQIAPLGVTALVAGSHVYNVAIRIERLPDPPWRAICRDCAGAIDSLVELLQGRLSQAVMARLCRQDGGLFPRPSEIRFSCSCPDGALLCKHVAAALYGVGVQLDAQPDLLFRLRGVDETALVGGFEAVAAAVSAPAEGKLLGESDLSGLFGLDIAPNADAVAAPAAAPAMRPAKPARPAAKQASPPKARVTATKAPAPVSLAAARQAATAASKPRKALAPAPAKTAAPAGGRKDRSRPEYELTKDGFVKWWKKPNGKSGQR